MVAGNEGLRRASVRLASWPEGTEGSCIDLGALGWAGAAVFHTRANSPGPEGGCWLLQVPPEATHLWWGQSSENFPEASRSPWSWGRESHWGPPFSKRTGEKWGYIKRQWVPRNLERGWTGGQVMRGPKRPLIHSRPKCSNSLGKRAEISV